MIEQHITLFEILDHLQSSNTKIFLSRKAGWQGWEDRDWHNLAYRQNPEIYALLATLDGVSDWQRVRVLYLLLESSRERQALALRQTLNRVVNFLFGVLHPDQVLAVFLGLKQARVNHKHTSRAVLSYLLNHPELESLAYLRRPAVEDALEHALGKNVARASLKYLSQGTEDDYVKSNLLRFARNPQKVHSAIPLLYSRSQEQTLEEDGAAEKYSALFQRNTTILHEGQERARTVTATNRGNISATLVHLYRGGRNSQLEEALTGYVEEASANLPTFAGKVALVLDNSTSTKGYGDREFAILSQSVALWKILARQCPDLKTYLAGKSEASGEFPLPLPEGATDLAAPLLMALEDEPDLVAIVSDGYENVFEGDLARIAASLKAAGITTPVVFCQSKFTNMDDLSLRTPASNLPALSFWHEADFTGILTNLFALAGEKFGQPGLKNFALQRLARFEKELELWTL